MEKKLLVLARNPPLDERRIEFDLSRVLSGLVDKVVVRGQGIPLSEVDLAVDMVRECDIYVGLATRELKESLKVAGPKYGKIGGNLDAYLLGERGFQLALENDIPAILFDRLSYPSILDFVKRRT